MKAVTPNGCAMPFHCQPHPFGTFEGGTIAGAQRAP
jgi:hypothetical protein